MAFCRLYAASVFYNVKPLILPSCSRRVNHRLEACLGRQGTKTVNENYVKKIEILIGTSNVFRR